MYSSGTCVLLIPPVLSPQRRGVFQLRTLVSNSCSELEHNTSSKAEVMMDLSYWTNVGECCSYSFAVEGQMRACLVVCGLLKSFLHCVSKVMMILDLVY